MPTTCVLRLALLTTLLAGIAFPQGLEEKVAEARRMQSKSLGSMDEIVEDSAVAEKRGGIAPSGGTLRARKSPGKGKPSLDSVLSSPQLADSLATAPDTLWLKDSLNNYHPIPNPLKQVPGRYEQRLFGSMEPGAFSNSAGSAGRDYILGAGDEISVYLWGDKEKEYDLTLNSDGKIFLEGIGSVQLAGFSLDQALAQLKQRLSKVYSGISRGTTHVDLSLGKAGPIRVYVLGEVRVPGGYVFTGQTSVLSAFYFAKGPTDIGSVRNVQLTRSGNKFTLDLYQYLLKGQTLSPHTLQDGDILFSPRAEILVRIEGDVGRPAIYELRKGEGIKELIEYAGGINPTAAEHRLSLQRYLPDGRPENIDLTSPQDYLSGKSKQELRNGDKVILRKSTETSRDFLVVTGPVKYPGTYDATGITTVNLLVEKAGGLREDAYLGRVHIVRFNPDGSSNLLAYSLDSVGADAITLLPRDNVILYSLKDMYLPDSVQVAGAVFKPGKYIFRSGSTVMDVVMEAGGFLPHHEEGRAIVFRGDGRSRKVEQIVVPLGAGMDKHDAGFRLMPGDLIQIPTDPKWYVKEVVTLDGLFRYPGKYALLYPGEKLSSVIDRAGGFKDNAYVEGGRFFRSRDSVGHIGVDISQAIRHPDSKTNIGLAGGDSIYIPERLNTVKIIGEVGYETSVLFKQGASVQYYIEKAGGFTRRSEKNRVVVQYANGETSRDGYFNRKPDAGSVIYIPQGPEPKPVDWFMGINALLGTAGVAVALILSIQAISK